MPRSHSRLGAAEIVSPDRLDRRAEINITPLIDILLVLLVIFMAALPLTQKAIDTNLPQASRLHGQPPAGQVVLEYSADGRIAINKKDVSADALEGRLKMI